MTLKFITWDVEHGSAAYVRTPNNKNIVIDLGARRSVDAGFSPLAHLWNKWGVRHLDLVVVTHPHLDHIEDIINFDAFSPDTFIRPNHLTEKDIWGGNKKASPETQKIVGKYIALNKEYNQPSNRAKDPRVPANYGGVSLEFFRPVRCPADNVNNHSVVTVMTYAGVKFLLPGDNEPPSWSELLSDRTFLKSIEGTHVMVASHHGRRSGYHNPLFEHISPLITIVSDGRYVDTSATGRYSAVSTGWDVNKRRGGWDTRYCVTTRNDGVIDVGVTPGTYNTKPTLSVTID